MWHRRWGVGFGHANILTFNFRCKIVSISSTSTKHEGNASFQFVAIIITFQVSMAMAWKIASYLNEWRRVNIINLINNTIWFDQAAIMIILTYLTRPCTYYRIVVRYRSNRNWWRGYSRFSCSPSVHLFNAFWIARVISLKIIGITLASAIGKFLTFSCSLVEVITLAGVDARTFGLVNSWLCMKNNSTHLNHNVFENDALFFY